MIQGYESTAEMHPALIQDLSKKPNSARVACAGDNCEKPETIPAGVSVQTARVTIYARQAG